MVPVKGRFHAHPVALEPTVISTNFRRGKIAERAWRMKDLSRSLCRSTCKESNTDQLFCAVLSVRAITRRWDARKPIGHPGDGRVRTVKGRKAVAAALDLKEPHARSALAQLLAVTSRDGGTHDTIGGALRQEYWDAGR